MARLGRALALLAGLASLSRVWSITMDPCAELEPIRKVR